MNYNRNTSGLLDGVEYQYNEDGSINWRAMIASEHLYPNKGWFEARNKPMPDSVEGLADHQLLIKLSGIKELAKLRGFTKVAYQIVKCDMEHVAVKCAITWSPHFESSGQEVYFEDIANATTYNTSSFAQKFLETIAANRAFVRCVRNFLNIHIVGADEIDTSNGKKAVNFQQKEASSYGPLTTLMACLQLDDSEEGFETFKGVLRSLWKNKKYQNEDAANWESWQDIPKLEIVKLVKIVKDL